MPETGAHHLDDEERMAFGALKQQRPEGPVERPAGDAVGQCQGGVLAQRAEFDLGEIPGATQPGQPGVERRLALLLRTDGRDDE